MAKNESTAINSLINIARGRIVDGPGPDLFSTNGQSQNLFAAPVQMPMQQMPMQQMPPVQPVAPRRLANGTPSPIARGPVAPAPVVRAHYKAQTRLNPVSQQHAAAVAEMSSFEDDDNVMTCRVDPALREEALRQANAEIARKAAERAVSDLEQSGVRTGERQPAPYAPSYAQAPTVHAQPVYPQQAYSQQAYAQSGYAQRPPYVQPTYPQANSYPAQSTPMHAGAYRAYGAAPRSQRPVTYLTFGQEIRLLLTRYTLQAGAVVVLLAISVSYVLLHRNHAHAAPAPALAASLTAAPVISVDVAAPVMHAPTVEPITMPAPSVTPIVEAAPAPIRAPVAAAPVAPAPEVVAVAAPAEDIELAPVAAKKHHHHHEKRVAARTAPAPMPRAKTEKPTREPVVKVQRSKKEIASDPVLAELSKPVKGSKGDPTGPGKVSITSNEPANIYIDGRASQMQTPQTISLPPGAHRITLLSVATNKAKTSDIDIESGKTIKVTRQF
ncbi:MAG TPA: hypothetical protein VGM90_12885 [Kofleriaceae bacterium]|jgi:hypothetical protein